MKWALNRDGKKLSIAEAVSVAIRYGVIISADVVFFEAEEDELDGDWDDLVAGNGTTARGPAVRGNRAGYIYWNDHRNPKGKIAFDLNPAILSSDEAIVAVITHELYELEELRARFDESDENWMEAVEYERQVMAGVPGNLHDKAWTAADEAVKRMREAKP
jgi:hypothetical protein